MNLVDELHGVASALTEAGIAHAVCGGIAVTAHGATRTLSVVSRDVLVRMKRLAGRPQDLADLENLGVDDG